MDLRSLRNKGVAPRASQRAVCRGWRLRFNVTHFFRHEGGVANIEPSQTGDIVHGVVHLCDDGDLALLDAAEACGHGYNRIGLSVFTDEGKWRAIAYVGTPSFINNECRPSQRYLNIVVRGATAASLDLTYIEALRRYPVQPSPAAIRPFEPPQGEFPTFNSATLRQFPLLTALAGAVFDMSGARWQHKFLHSIFSGKDMTLFHLKRLDNSNGNETLEDVKHGRLTPIQQRYLDEYLHEYSNEYVYVGRYVYD
jgi:sulfite reductase (NADPH) flavoprotein alpha-component